MGVAIWTKIWKVFGNCLEEVISTCSGPRLSLRNYTRLGSGFSCCSTGVLSKRATLNNALSIFKQASLGSSLLGRERAGLSGHLWPVLGSRFWAVGVRCQCQVSAVVLTCWMRTVQMSQCILPHAQSMSSCQISDSHIGCTEVSHVGFPSFPDMSTVFLTEFFPKTS